MILGETLNWTEMQYWIIKYM